jgi:hypothetical protein
MNDEVFDAGDVLTLRIRARDEGRQLAGLALRVSGQSVEKVRADITITLEHVAAIRRLCPTANVEWSAQYRALVLASFEKCILDPTMIPQRRKKRPGVDVEKVRRLRSLGFSWPKIALELHMPYSTLCSRLRHEVVLRETPRFRKGVEAPHILRALRAAQSLGRNR